MTALATPNKPLRHGHCTTALYPAAIILAEYRNRTVKTIPAAVPHHVQKFIK
jgi:hypothetical protein